MEFYAYCDAVYVTAVTEPKSCKIHMSDFHNGQQLAGFVQGWIATPAGCIGRGSICT